MSIWSKNLIYSITIFLGGIGSIIFGLAPMIGSILIMIGVLGGIFSLISQEFKSKQGDYLLDAQAVLLARHGAGNIYTEAVKLELRKTGSSKNAKHLLLKALEIEPNNLDALTMLCTILALELSFSQWANPASKEDTTKNTLELAKRLTKRGLVLAPNSHVFHDTKGMIYDFEGKHNKARKKFHHSSLLRTDPYWHLLLATSLHMSGKNDEALLEMQKCRQANASGWLFEFYYGRALMSVGDYETALKNIGNARKFAKWKVEIISLLSEIHFLIGNHIKGSILLFIIGILLISISYNMGIKFLFRSFIGFVVGLIFRISKLTWKVTKYIPLVRSLHLKLLPPFQPEFSLAFSLIEKKRFASAENLLRRARKVVPKWSEIHANLALCLIMQGKKAEAIESIDCALELDPNNRAYAWNKEQFLNESPLNIKSF